ncbi:MAG: RdgB/HAM1 family non-canonical purine NTP pyrophosphatase [Planctomycetota bacterium]|mgnify:CR=1 FL=1
MKSKLRLLIGTRNKGKIREIKALFKNLPIKFISLAQFKHVPPTKETGRTYQANAEKKALVLARITPVRLTGELVLAEDSGIEVKALGGRPGIYSARYSGAGATDEKNNAKLLKELNGLPPSRRQARYRSVVVLANQKGILFSATGTCAGRIATELKGKNGFGYDPLFIPTGYTKTFGQLPIKIKHRISHRARAIRKLINKISNY